MRPRHPSFPGDLPVAGVREEEELVSEPAVRRGQVAHAGHHALEDLPAQLRQGRAGAHLAPGARLAPYPYQVVPRGGVHHELHAKMELIQSSIHLGGD